MLIIYLLKKDFEFEYTFKNYLFLILHHVYNYLYNYHNKMNKYNKNVN